MRAARTQTYTCMGCLHCSQRLNLLHHDANTLSPPINKGIFASEGEAIERIYKSVPWNEARLQLDSVGLGLRELAGCGL